MINRQRAVKYWCRSSPENQEGNDRKSTTTHTVVSTLLLFCTMFIILHMSSFIQVKPVPHYCQCESSTTLKRTLYRDRLEKALAEAATEDKTVIITIINEAYVERNSNKSMLDLFLDSFWLGDGTRGLVDHLLVVAVDRNSYRRCRFLRLHCYELETEGGEFVGEKMFMSEDFIKFMWRRTLFLGEVLRRGYHFIFTDTDILWLRNPFPFLRTNTTIDLQISSDKFYGDDLFHQANYINTGFYMIKSNKKTIAMFDAWYAARKDNIGWKEQDVLIKLINMNNGLFRQLGLKVKFLDTLYFSGFCQNSKNVQRVVTVHGNCCQSISAKLSDLTAVIHDWKRFRNSSSNGTTFRWSDHVNCWNSWKI